MEPKVRELSKEDIPAFFALCREMAQEGAGVGFARITAPEQVGEMLDNERYFLLGAFVNGTMVGAFQARRGEAGKEHSCHIAGAMTNSWRRRGLGKLMLEHALPFLKDKGMWLIRAYVYSNNTPSIASLLSAGFTWAGTVYKHQWDEKEQRYIDDLIFHKELE